MIPASSMSRIRPLTKHREHLYKHHFVQVCKRCCGVFKEPQDLEAHSKAATPCSVKLERDYGDGFDDNQYKLLKARNSKREYKGDELEYWKGVYRILFPGMGMDPALSPCKSACQESIEQITDMDSGYEAEDVSKKSYDELCARAREQDPALRTQILQLIHDPEQVDPVQSILALINSHQAGFISPDTNGSNPASLRTIGTSPLMSSGGSSMYLQPQLGGSSVNFNVSPFSQMSAPWLSQQSNSYSDSGFYSGLYSGSSTTTDVDSFTFPPQAAESVDILNSAKGQSIRISTSVPMTAGANSAENFDFDKFMSWDGKDVQTQTPGNSQERALSTEGADEEE